MESLKALPRLVRRQFKAAQEAGDLTFYATQVSILRCNDLPFQLRFSPTLANKPKAKKSEGNTKPVDPFESPQKGLFIANLEPSHYLVLNKFPVIPNHFILATTTFKEQTDLLEEADIEAAYRCLEAYRENGEELFGFFNSGNFSGASQAHRHIQFLPVESMRSGIKPSEEWSVLADSLLKQKDLPFTYFASEISRDATPGQLHELYVKMHQQACLASEKYQISSPTGTPLISKSTRDHESPISYNLGFTDRVMLLCPRVSEGLEIESADGNKIEPIALNGAVLGGTLLVKSEGEWQTLQNDFSKLQHVLGAIGIPPAASSHNEHL
ncbi:hypothetical protein HYALB_00002064 [Hymenoscyphus albidus]|uniref:Ap4A phosphorylase II n=1 Tax=Hymenoscyphus albidus TaxID=595503 RepID=A0A9N9LA99_9HELO|nr:hypothetical protein HYALB_00002064 [Hymenoscyphus albidus]